MKELRIGNRIISQQNPAYIIAEMSANHAGSLSNALEIVHAAKESGADCVKVQTYTADTITLDCRKPDFMLQSGTWSGYNLHDLYKEAYTPWEWQGKIKEEAEKIGLDFLSTPFDNTAVDFLEDLNVDFYKIASSEIVDIPLIQYAAEKGKPMIISTGMASVEEIEEAVMAVRSTGNDQLALLKCSTLYPAIPQKMNLITVSDLAERFDVISGLSDHSMGSLASVIAVALGGRIIEKHFCLDRRIKNPDSSFSMEPQEFKQMVDEVRATQAAIGETPYSYGEDELYGRGFRRSLYVSKDIKSGEEFTAENLRSVRPGKGLHTRYYYEILGRKAACDIEMGTPLRWELVK
ncbi:pseudaminic acid synthase [Desulfosporosinus acididurans]|uniref:Pseudaminic acid synthase n=1 Tax=Desulfosporosinus acididurans TaxID=476652 RepID=A0A0J1FRC2_9FIRM|nr:pseudaminic acid synthase [Desulfosporosinus acididurans]KLU65867.1 pseudaminic acid synthase [Desulfosporosinus acididurans]